MKRAIVIWRRELDALLHAPAAWIVMALFTGLCGWFFIHLVRYFQLGALRAMQNPLQARALDLTTSVLHPYYSDVSLILLLLVVPALTMRLVAEERRSGSAELLFSWPVTEFDVVVGKYLAAASVFTVMLAVTLVFPAALSRWSTLDPGPVITGTLGILLMGYAFLAMGVFFSALAVNQFVAGMLSASFGILFLLVAWIEPFVPERLAVVVAQVSVLGHFGNFAVGVLDTSDVVYYVLVAATFLFLAVRVLESRRWRGLG